MQKVELLSEIERTRNEMHQLAKKHSLFSGIVLAKSRQLDRLLNQYKPAYRKRHSAQ